MNRPLTRIGGLALVAAISVSCARLEVNHRCCNNEYEITTQNYNLPDSFTLFIPQAFTPNADGINDQFRPIGMGWRVEHMEIRKGGKVVYESNSHLEAFWDGGDERDGRYNYRFTMRSSTGDPFELKGDVCLMRFGEPGERLPELEETQICDCITHDMIDPVEGVIYEGQDCPTNGF